MTRFLLAVTLFAVPASAETIQKSGTFAGMKVEYKVILPLAYDPTRAYPAVLTFGGGPQTMDTVDRMQQRNWRAEAERRGYIIVSPAAPNGLLFFQDGSGIFPEFLDRIMRDYKVEAGKLHIAGPSNGGISAFHVAAKYPRYFRSITGYPGYLPEDSNSNVDGLKGTCVFMHVGELDTPWLVEMRQQSERFRQRGVRARFTVEKGQGHGIATLAGDGAKRLFDQLDEAAKGCN